MITGTVKRPRTDPFRRPSIAGCRASICRLGIRAPSSHALLSELSARENASCGAGPASATLAVCGRQISRRPRSRRCSARLPAFPHRRSPAGLLSHGIALLEVAMARRSSRAFFARRPPRALGRGDCPGGRHACAFRMPADDGSSRRADMAVVSPRPQITCFSASRRGDRRRRAGR